MTTDMPAYRATWTPPETETDTRHPSCPYADAHWPHKIGDDFCPGSSDRKDH